MTYDPHQLVSEIDQRTIPGNGGTVTLWKVQDSYSILVEGPDGREVASIVAHNPAEALDAYRHTFARPEVPNIFALDHAC